jgi:hypothetical protein
MVAIVFERNEKIWDTLAKKLIGDRLILDKK